MADQGSFLKPTFRRVFLLANRPILEGSDSLAEVFQRAGLDIKVLGYMSGPPQRATSFRTSVAGPPFFPARPLPRRPEFLLLFTRNQDAGRSSATGPRPCRLLVDAPGHACCRLGSRPAAFIHLRKRGVHATVQLTCGHEIGMHTSFAMFSPGHSKTGHSNQHDSGENPIGPGCCHGTIMERK